MPIQHLSLAIVGMRHENRRRKGMPTGHRQSEILMSSPGEIVELRAEPDNPVDGNAVAAYSARGVQIGYVRGERTAILRAAWRNGREVRAIFQEAVPFGAIVRVAFDGLDPVLPVRDPAPAPIDDGDFWPDEIPVEDW
jgi:hypothetical protein